MTLNRLLHYLFSIGRRYFVKYPPNRINRKVINQLIIPKNLNILANIFIIATRDKPMNVILV